MLRVAYDTGCRGSELVAITIGDIDGPDADGAGTLAIGATKADRERAGALAYLSPATMRAVAGTEQVALVKGRIDPDTPTLVRMHALNPFADLLGEADDRAGVLQRSMEMIAAEDTGVIVVINRPRNDPFTSAIRSKIGEHVADMEELRDYGVGAMILTELGVGEMELLTSTHHTLVALAGYVLSIIGEWKLEHGSSMAAGADRPECSRRPG